MGGVVVVGNARDVVFAGHKDWLNAAYGSEEIGQLYLLFQQVGRLEHIAPKAEIAGDFRLQWMPLRLWPEGFPRSPDSLLPALSISTGIQ